MSRPSWPTCRGSRRPAPVKIATRDMVLGRIVLSWMDRCVEAVPIAGTTRVVHAAPFTVCSSSYFSLPSHFRPCALYYCFRPGFLSPLSIFPSFPLKRENIFWAFMVRERKPCQLISVYLETNNPQAHQPAILPAGAAAGNYGLPVLAPAGGIPHMSQPPQIPQTFDGGEANNIFQQAWSELPNLGSREAQLRLKITLSTQQLALAWAEYNEFQATRAAQRGSMGSQGMMPQGSGTGEGASQVPDATMEEGHGEDVGP